MRGLYLKLRGRREGPDWTVGADTEEAVLGQLPGRPGEGVRVVLAQSVPFHHASSSLRIRSSRQMCRFRVTLRRLAQRH